MATSLFEQQDTVFVVLTNQQNQHSLWPKFKTVPGGWQAVGVEGNKQTCVDYIEKEWADMRPKTLCEFMNGL